MKKTKLQAKYRIQKRKQISGPYSCYNCIHLKDNWKTCNKVEGYISKNGLCTLFETMTLKRQTPDESYDAMERAEMVMEHKLDRHLRSQE